MTNPDERVAAVARAIEGARCLWREGPYGGYDYGHDPDFYGPAPQGGRYVIRDFRQPGAKGEWVHQTDDREVHEAELERLTQAHIAQAALDADDKWLKDNELVVVPVEPTNEMYLAGERVDDSLCPEAVYKAMIEAARP